MDAFDPTDIFAALNAAQVKYLLIGGLAVIFHGIRRTTGDVDLSVHLTTDNLERLAMALRHLGFVPRVPAPIAGLADPKTRRMWTQQRGMKVYSFIEPYGIPPRNIDVMVEPLKDFEAVYRRRKVAALRGIPVPLIPVKELAQMKRKAGRPQDLQDVQDLRLAGKIP
ncbi:MAG: hypothetical protein HY352_00835 [Candidatus Omnitrophica bacterium]|nr:hypothetical protein [Candidatus Omnitrophota bacterium]